MSLVLNKWIDLILTMLRTFLFKIVSSFEGVKRH